MTTWELVVRFAPTVLGITVVPCAVAVGIMMIGTGIRPSSARSRGER